MWWCTLDRNMNIKWERVYYVEITYNIVYMNSTGLVSRLYLLYILFIEHLAFPAINSSVSRQQRNNLRHLFLDQDKMYRFLE